MIRTYLVPYVVLLLMATLLSGIADAQRGPGNGRGFGQGGQGGQHGQDERHDEDRQLFHFLLTNHEKISRTVRELPNGVETLTESDDPAIAAKIQEHVRWMQYRVEESKPIRMRDPLFAEIFRHTNKIKMVRVDTDKGVRVTETSGDPYVVKLIKAHAQAVSGFVAKGFSEAMKNHPVPEEVGADSPKYSHPAIAKYGKVVTLPDATQQPRDGSRIVVDVTHGGEPDKLNTALDKVARFVNIYRGAGKKSAQVDIAIVLHGDATLTILNEDAYAARFQTKGNPNLDCLQALHEADVQIFVCGQSLIGSKAKPDQVVVFADVAVSALTALVNLQTDGYAYVPLGK
ncbi:DsrE family protein [Novipirellula rosea]|uniref:DsrE family protein n=1 Tax=Novipirellula rosea TaxID=1031540 RepID=A0ABP8NDC0_9BACT